MCWKTSDVWLRVLRLEKRGRRGQRDRRCALDADREGPGLEAVRNNGDSVSSLRRAREASTAKLFPGKHSGHVPGALGHPTASEHNVRTTASFPVLSP